MDMTQYVSARIQESASDTRTLPNDGFGTGTYPNWVRWVSGTGSTTSDGALSPAVGGEYSTPVLAVIDLSAAVGNAVGRQVLQNQTFRINYLGVSIENDDSGDNNDESFAGSGRFRFYSPSTHRIEAYQTYRQAHRIHYGGGSTTGSAAFSTDGTGGQYKGLRVGLTQMTSVEEVPYTSNDPFSDISGAYPHLYNIFTAFDNAHGKTGEEMDNRLWRDGRTGHPQAINWTASITNAGGSGVAGRNQGFHLNGLDLEAMCGLLLFSVDGTQSDDVVSFDDEYHIRVTVGVEGWGGEF